MFKTINYHWRRLIYIFREIPLMVKANEINARYIDIPAKKNRVNIFEYHPDVKNEVSQNEIN